MFLGTYFRAEDLCGCVDLVDVDEDPGADFVAVEGGFVLAESVRWIMVWLVMSGFIWFKLSMQQLTYVIRSMAPSL